MSPSLPSKLESFFETMRRGEEFAQHGFDLLAKRSEPEQFFDALNQHGFFDPANNLGPVPSANPEFVHIPVWAPLNYLEAVASRAAELNDESLAKKVLNIIRAVTRFKDEKSGEPRDNYRTYFKFAEFLGVLPLRCITLDDARLVRVWLVSKYDRSLVPHALTKGLLKRLFDDGTTESVTKACVVIESCLELESSSKRRKRSEDLATVVDDHWLKEMLGAYARELGRKAGAQAVLIFERGLRTIYSDERRSYGSSLWRPAIESNSQNRDFYGPENRFVEGLRDVLDGWLETAPEAAAIYVEQALKDDLEIIRRVALHAVTEHFELLRPVFEPLIAPAIFLSGHRHELYRLLSLRFHELSPEGKSKVVEAIRNLPIPSRGDDRERRLKFTQREWLSSIKDHAESADWFSELKTDPELGPVTEHPDFLAYHESRWGPGPAPFEADSLVAFAEDGTLIERLNGFKQGDSWRGPTLGGLVSALETAVATKPNTFLSLLSDFHSANVPFQHALLQGYKKLFDPSNDKRPEFDWKSAWPKLMMFFSETVTQDSFWIRAEEGVDLVPTWDWMRGLIASFLEAATRDDKTAYPPELLPQGWAIIKLMLARAEAGVLNLTDPMTHALNTDKGHVIGAMYNHALRVCRLADQSNQSHEIAWGELKDTFDAEIAKCCNGNYEFSTLSASYIANLDYLSRAWLTENVGRLFPARDYPNNFKVAIGGLAYAGTSRPIYQLLASQSVFAEALAAELEDKNGRERVIEWVGLAYLWNDEQLDSQIVQAVFAGGVEDVEKLAEFFWEVRGDELTEEQVEKVLAFWERSLSWSKGSGETSDHLMARLSRLSPYIKELNARTMPILMSVVPYVHTDYGTDQMVEELTRLLDTDAAGVAVLLERMLDSSAPTFDLDDKLKALIEKLASLGLRAEAIRCTEKVRRTLPGMLDLYKKLVASG
ncbi:hypothetical protein [Afipia sp. GAS231]|uniref:hypothetical protein n=1 Tax=Afipia sp. GAS231 TaxID=1882747 RepID=UPI0008792B78|nr:hypothetical protein [Afipia sp. GAS231]SDP22073.1 hypothetical protein SAMN05444050_6179 [Afipia sp. GAS231]